MHSFRERIRINGELIPQECVTALWEQMRPEVETLPQTTAFEIITALAFLHFRQKQVDWAVIEVGLGGRLDATNVIRPRACAITSLSLEHTELLGSTLDRIAYEKAGIIKPGVPVITAAQAPEAMAVIADVAARNEAPLWQVGPEGDWRYTVHTADQYGLRLDLYGPDAIYEALWVPLVGHHQAINAGVAVAMAHALNDARLSPDVVRQGLAQTIWPGRLELLPRRPGMASILVDGAHNRHSAEQVLNALALFPRNRLILLFGASAAKDIAGMLEVLRPVSDAVVVTRSYHPRAADPHDLAGLVRTIVPTKPVFVADEALTALQMALEQTTDADLILGYLDPEYFLGGRMKLDVEAARRAISEHVCRPLGLELLDAAAGIHELINETMAAAAKTHIAEKGGNPRLVTIAAFGGAGPVHAAGLARRLGAGRIVVPPSAGVGSAMGFFVAPRAFDLLRSHKVELSQARLDELEAIFEELEREGAAILRTCGAEEKVSCSRTLDLRFVGQGYETRLELRDGRPVEIGAARLREMFDREYERLYGRSYPDSPVEVVNLGVRASLPVRPFSPAAAMPAPSGRKRPSERPAFDLGTRRMVEHRVIERAMCKPGEKIQGPALVEEPETTTVVPSGAVAWLDELGYLHVELPQATVREAGR
ncbi:MAG: hypothetical protein D6806_18415 [Deltaproteobacteria bacterium]|nr:MAG: hypothetical protein D6806_18415 [Deltaproteobacteria bacterium]